MQSGDIHCGGHLSIMDSGSGEVLDRSSMSTDFSNESDAAKELYEKEIDSLVELFSEENDMQAVLKNRKDSGTGGTNIQRRKIATLLEGSRLPFSVLVKDVFEKLSGAIDLNASKGVLVTLASVRSTVLSLGERVSFGITNADTDVLEDDAVRSLWRWEVRDAKLLPKGSRDEILDRRRWLRKIAGRMTALSAAVESLGPAGAVDQIAYEKAKEGLSQIDGESAIRAAKITWQLKIISGSGSTGHQANPVQKDLLLELPTQQEPAPKRRKVDPEEKEKLRIDKLLKRQQAENEKEQKRRDREEAERKKSQQRHQDEAERELKRKEKEEGERKKQEKKQQEEAEKELKREAERKKQLALKKQASFMDRFLVKKDQGSCVLSNRSDAPAMSPVEESQKRESASQSEQAAESAAIVARMDEELRNSDCVEIEALRRMHVNHWLSLRGLIASRNVRRWSVRRKPKVSVFRELRLQGALGDPRAPCPDESHVKKGTENASPGSNVKRTREDFDCSEDIDWKDNVADSFPDSPDEESKKVSSDRFHHVRKKQRKLLQFDKSHRPPYFGTFSKTSTFVTPRRPFKQDRMLDYEVDSDEEWEEEDPGESLSDAEKDEEDEKVEVEEIEDDEEGADEFVVPDGYLSEDEGVAMDDSGHKYDAQEGSSAQSPKTPITHNVMSPERLRKVLDSATDRALRSNHPLVVSNLGQVPGLESKVPSSQFPSNRTETMCLEALRIRVLVPNLFIGVC